MVTDPPCPHALETATEHVDDAYWDGVATHVAPRMPPRPVIVELGCAPALMSHAFQQHFPQATLYAYDVTEALHTGTAPSLPLATGTVHLISMASVLHRCDDPFPMLAEVHRLLAPTGLFLLYDWVRRPLQDYLLGSLAQADAEPQTSRHRAVCTFPVHNKYTTADWQWLLHEAEFALLRGVQLRPTHRMFLAIPTGS